MEIVQGKSIWDVDESAMCCLVDFLLEKAGSVFMMGLISLNRRKTFEDYFALLPGYLSQRDFTRLKEGLLLYGEIIGKESAYPFVHLRENDLNPNSDLLLLFLR